MSRRSRSDDANMRLWSALWTCGVSLRHWAANSGRRCLHLAVVVLWLSISWSAQPAAASRRGFKRVKPTQPLARPKGQCPVRGGERHATHSAQARPQLRKLDTGIDAA